jgi:cellobiose-specific phosphotransferase system component IIC
MKTTIKIVAPVTVAITYTVPNMMVTTLATKEAVATVLRAVNAAYYMGAL